MNGNADTGPCAQLRLLACTRLFRLALPVVLLGLTFAALRSLRTSAWPFAHADLRLVGLSCAFVASSFFARAYAWRELLRAEQRPGHAQMAVAISASAAAGSVLPPGGGGLLKLTLLHRIKPALSLQAAAASLGLLGILDLIAMAPLAIVALILSSGKPQLQTLAGVTILISGGAAAVAVSSGFFLSRFGGERERGRIGSVIAQIAASLSDPREELHALAKLSLNWLVRAAGTISLCEAFHLHHAWRLAVLYLCLSAAASLVPVAPVGATAQVGAGAAIFSACGVSLHMATTIALAASMLSVAAAVVALTSALVLLAGSALARGERGSVKELLGLAQA